MTFIGTAHWMCFLWKKIWTWQQFLRKVEFKNLIFKEFLKPGWNYFHGNEAMFRWISSLGPCSRHSFSTSITFCSVLGVIWVFRFSHGLCYNNSIISISIVFELNHVLFSDVENAYNLRIETVSRVQEGRILEYVIRNEITNWIG